MQLIKRIGFQILALIIIISASGFTISVHHCCGKIKGINFFAESKGCQIHKKSAKGHTQNNVPASSVTSKSCCYNQKISNPANMQSSGEKMPIRSQSMPVLYLIQSLFNNWFGSSEHVEVKVKPYTILWYQEPLNILFRQFKI
ncbi:HYC_CC_PP family protein [Arcticibacter svalbardensis]|uniref:HYC_CC_PP family protein n=1 Tax=Arcticibacter svalbardensis TaxID=1288027 RepID=UPI00058C257D|nr:hypothetical protein [Arcticibacter svalbardensis]